MDEAEAIARYIAEVKGVDQSVLFWLAIIHSRGRIVSVTTLAELTNLNKATVIRSLTRLKVQGVIKVRRSRGRTNRYKLVGYNFEPVAESNKPKRDTEEVEALREAIDDLEHLAEFEPWLLRRENSTRYDAEAWRANGSMWRKGLPRRRKGRDTVTYVEMLDSAAYELDFETPDALLDKTQELHDLKRRLQVALRVSAT